MSIFDLFRRPASDALKDHRFAIKSQGEPELALSALEQAIADRYESLPRTCRRSIDRQNVKSWQGLHNLTAAHLKPLHGD